MEAVEIAAERLRRAVAAGSYEQAVDRSAEYGRAVRVAGSGPTLREALELLEWARRVALSSRAHCAEQLAALPDLRPYRAPAAARHTWRIEG